MKFNLIYTKYQLNSTLNKNGVHEFNRLPAWKINEVREEQIDLETYERITSKETIEFFENLGGQEIIFRDCNGLINELVSVSPCGTMKSVREFEIA